MADDEIGRLPAGAAPAPTGFQSRLPVLPPMVAILEILLLVVLPGLLDHFVPAFPSLNDTQPHFFWLPVLLLSVQYGTVSGLLAAGCSILLSALLGWPEQEIGENHFSYLLRIGLQPVLWLTAAIILGQFRLRQIEQKVVLSQTVGELAAQRHAIAEHARNLRTRCETLERIIACRNEPAGQEVLAAIGRVVTGERGSAADALQEMMAAAFPRSVLSLWARDGEGAHLVVRHGSPSRGARPVLGSEIPVVTGVLGHGRSVSVLSAGDEATLAGAGLAAVPVFGASGGEPVGLLLLEDADPADLDEHVLLRLAALAFASTGAAAREPAASSVSAAATGSAREPVKLGRPLLTPVLRQLKLQPRSRLSRRPGGKSA